MKSGFTLIELLVYLAVFSIMLFVAFHFVAATHVRFMGASRRSNQQMYFYTAHQAMSRMLERASPAKKSWKKLEDHELVFHDNDRDVGFAFDKKRLIKKTGIYNDGLGWRSKHTSILAEHIEDFHFQYDIIGDVLVGISWELMAKHGEKTYTIKQYVCLRNRNSIR